MQHSAAATQSPLMQSGNLRASAVTTRLSLDPPIGSASGADRGFGGVRVSGGKGARDLAVLVFQLGCVWLRSRGCWVVRTRGLLAGADLIDHGRPRGLPGPGFGKVQGDRSS